jgi:Flp pilus assembly pilin Flp
LGFPAQLGRPDSKKEEALSAFFGQAGAKSVKYALIATFFSAVIFITLASLGANFSNTTFDLALSSPAER